ncbi:MAG: hypothetical protein AAFW75_25125, partial [Cyanobacteria bacterium J06636_16]
MPARYRSSLGVEISRNECIAVGWRRGTRPNIADIPLCWVLLALQPNLPEKIFRVFSFSKTTLEAIAIAIQTRDRLLTVL